MVAFAAGPLLRGDIYRTRDKQGNLVYTNSNKNIKRSDYYRNVRFDETVWNKGRKRYGALIDKHAGASGVSKKLIASIIYVESYFNARAVSNKGAKGLMQIMPATAKRYNVSQPFDPEQNIRCGSAYLRYLLTRFKGDTPLVLAAYNAGETAVARHKGIPPYRETRNYVKKVLYVYNKVTDKIYKYVDKNGITRYTNDAAKIPAHK